MFLPLMNRRVSASSHCRSLLEAPSVVNGLSSEPSIFINQISLLATKATLSAPPSIGSAGTAGSVGAGGVSVLVASTITTGISVELLMGVDASVLGGTDVDVLTGASVFAGLFIPLTRKKPPVAITPIAITGTMM